jgi:uncharacterized DUF497 family protein
MPWFDIVWDESLPHGNVAHLAEHGVSPDEAEEVLMNAIGREKTRSSGRWIAFGRTSSGREIAVVYEMIDPITVLPVTAFDLE